MTQRYTAAGLAIAIAIALGIASGVTMARAPVVVQDQPGAPVSAVLERKIQRRIVPGEVIVKQRDGVGALSVGQMAPRGFDSTVRITSGGEFVYRLSEASVGALSVTDSVQRTLAAVNQLKDVPGVEYAQPNYLYQIVQTTPSDPQFGQQWHYLVNGSGSGSSPGGIGLPAVWDTNKGDSRSVVAVLDTGILGKHPDIVGSPNLIPGFDMITDKTVANDGDGRDRDATDPGDASAAGECGFGSPADPSSWHGTHVAGTIGVGNTNNTIGVAGINWNVRVLPVRVLGKCGGSTSDIVDAIRWAAGLAVPGVPTNPADTRARVINLSLGGSQRCLPDKQAGDVGDPAMQSAINDAVKANVTVVVAAGNSAADASEFSPAGCDNVITVAASDSRGHFVGRYSNFGKTVEIMAPGGDLARGPSEGVYSMVDGGYAFYNGTSMAAPHVAGVAALLLACHPKLTPPDVLKRIQASSLPRTPAQGCPTGTCGAGLLNAMVATKPACLK